MTERSMILAILVSAVITFGLRAFPFVIFRGERQMPEWLVRLGKMLPTAIMAVLIVYCVKDVMADISGLLIPKICAILVVAASYQWKHNTLASIISGTAVYMILLRIM